MLDRRDRNPYTGAEFPVPAIVNPRLATFTLPAISTAEARNQHRDMLRRLGAARDTLWIAELSDSMAERNRRAILGRYERARRRRRHQPGQTATGLKGVQTDGEGLRGGDRRCAGIRHDAAMGAGVEILAGGRSDAGERPKPPPDLTL